MDYFIRKNDENNHRQINKKIIFLSMISFSILFLILILFRFNFFIKDDENEIAHSEFISDICESALEYMSINNYFVEKKVGTVYYVQIQDLIDTQIINTDNLIDPAYNKNLFGYSKYKKYLSPTLFVKLAVGDDRSLFCEEITSKNE